MHAGYATQRAVADELLARDVRRERTAETWAKSISNIELGEGRPHPLHLEWCAEHVESTEELKLLVRRAALACSWQDLRAWAPAGDLEQAGFAGLSATLERSGFGFDLRHAEPTHVFWFHRLRNPHLMHGVFSLAAAGALRAGLTVRLLLDDLPPLDDATDRLLGEWDLALGHWLRRAGASGSRLELVRFTEIVEGLTTTVDWFQFIERCLSYISVADYLRSAKLVPLPLTSSNDPVVVLPEAQAIRLRTPLVNWIVIEDQVKGVLEQDPGAGIVTLGGADERMLWDQWRGPVEMRQAVGHAYLRRMPLPVPPWRYPALNWRGRRMMDGGLHSVFRDASAETNPVVDAVADLAEWLYRTGVTLPSELGVNGLEPFDDLSGLFSPEDVRRATADDPIQLAGYLADSIGSWFYP